MKDNRKKHPKFHQIVGKTRDKLTSFVVFKRTISKST